MKATRKARLIGTGAAPDMPALAYLYSRLPFLLQRIDQIGTALFVIETGTLQITPLQFQLLDLLDATGPAAQIEIARRAGIDTSTASLVIANLIRRDLAARRTDDEDRRRKIVQITDAGQSILAPVAAAYARAQRRLFAPLGGQAQTLFETLEAMAESPSDAPSWQPSLPDEPARMAGCDAPISRSLGFLVRRCLQQTEANMAREIGPFDLTIRQYAALLIICFHPDIGESGLTRMLGYESSNAALICRLLLAKELIQADAAHERGRRRYRATGQGKAMMMAIEPGLTRAEVSLAGAMTAGEITHVQRMLGAIVADLDPVVRSPLVLFREVIAGPGWPAPLRPHLSVDIRVAAS